MCRHLGDKGEKSKVVTRGILTVRENEFSSHSGFLEQV